ncbi:Alg9-like mannosyltransferase family-domain-containing protein [Paraphoma chrysanthemicola]|uniref:Mannosyltransferase n=1 Tax=Paraphoma chrysanthemicola TaxID=798071 RepID=A0A8K0R0L3_9PLEO|nr:Alg9-like mannosyltransferase family-domain-containing protein [Paraphoma chrysanthemicola]
MEKPPQLPVRLALAVFAIANVAAALFAPIQDCDEVFNYWEPTHYLNHGYGLQTWEYSPEYAIRSWAYTALHSLIIFIGTLPFKVTGVARPKVVEFYFLRITLALVCALCQTRMYSVIARTMNPRVAIFFVLALVFSPGMYHAAPAYLPSTFAMYTTMLGFSAFMDWSGGIKTAQGIMWFALGTTLGWPFAGALVLPFLVEEAILASITGAVADGCSRVIQGAVGSILALSVQTGIDSIFYRKLTCVPLNIVLYNVFSSGSRGPDIYGVEPWHFYVRNLVLNFNMWFFLALLAFPLVIIQHFVLRKVVSNQTLLRSVVFVSPFYLWLTIFTAQPHKEERFMYPIYPALALNAAMSLHILLANFGSTNPAHLVSRIPASVKLALVSIPLLLSFDLGMLRTIGTLTAYSAPLNIYQPLHSAGVAQPGDNVCLGKEWYRYPSSFSLPQGVHAKFIKSEFSGLLPGEFSEANVGFGLFPGTWLVPSGMNDENLEDVGKYTDVKHCKFLIDSRLPSATTTVLEPDYLSDTEQWEKLKCVPFLDASQTHLLGRLLYVPGLPFVPERFRRKWGDYCLLRRRTPNTKPECPIALSMHLRVLGCSKWVCELAQWGSLIPRYHEINSVDDTGRTVTMSTLTPRLAKHVDTLREAARLHCTEFERILRQHCHTAKFHLDPVLKHVNVHPKAALYASLLLFTCTWLLVTVTRRLRTRARSRITPPNTPNLEKRSPFKAPDRPPGVWPPSTFTRPTAPPYPEWSITATKPLPYRPFRHGPKYNITMGLRTMHWDEWIELDNQFLDYHDLKAQRIIERGEKCCRTAPEAFEAAIELLEELCAYLSERYSSLYRKTGVGVENLVTGESFNILERPLQEDPMAMAGRLVQDDLAIMIEKKDGQYYLLAGSILLAGFWRLEDKFGMPLSEIHTSGDVPGFKEKLEKGMLNFFRRIQPQSPVLRNNYFIQVDDKLAWSESIGPEDSEGIGWFTAEKNKAIENHWFRSERQSLRRLPRSGGVVFTIRTYFHPVVDIAREPYVPGRLASAVRSWGDDVSKYKGKERYGDVLLEYLDNMHEEQVKDGLDLSREEEAHGYPY